MRAIDGDALDDFLASAEIEAVEKKRYVLAGALNTVRGNLLNFPTIEPKKGKWITKSTNGEMFDCCSACGYVEWDEPKNFCPNCGARMEEGEAEC